MVYFSIFIFILLIIIAATNIEINFRSSNDTIKIIVKVGFVQYVVPHQLIIKNMLESQREKPLIEQRNDFFELVNKRELLENIFKHSSLKELYIGRFKEDELYVNPLANGFYYIFSNQVKALASNLFKRIDHSLINLIYNPNYENLDYYIEIKTDVISLISAFIETKLKGK